LVKLIFTLAALQLRNWRLRDTGAAVDNNIAVSWKMASENKKERRGKVRKQQSVMVEDLTGIGSMGGEDTVLRCVCVCVWTLLVAEVAVMKTTTSLVVEHGEQNTLLVALLFWTSTSQWVAEGENPVRMTKPWQLSLNESTTHGSWALHIATSGGKNKQQKNEGFSRSWTDFVL
jgi:hypothetical protein